MLYARFINRNTLFPAPETFKDESGRTYTRFDRLPPEILNGFSFYPVTIWPCPEDGQSYAQIYELNTLPDGSKSIQNRWEEVIIPPQPVRYETKKVIEKMIATGLIVPVREALFSQNLYEIMLLEPVLSMDDPRFIKVLEMVAPIAESAGIADISAWLEDCKV